MDLEAQEDRAHPAGAALTPSCGSFPLSPATAACKPELCIKLLLNDVTMVCWPSPLLNSI